ncbi:MAG: hypothetical protein WA418_19475 [Bradyrhizobium sp.]
MLLALVLPSGQSVAAVPTTSKPGNPKLSIFRPAQQGKPATQARPATLAKPAARPAQPSPRIGDGFAPIAFALVRGPSDACGPGCDSWIAAEGKIDGGAAARFRKFMKQIGDRKLPIYFNSPGGNLEQALAIGTMLRERKAAVRVGRTTLRECGFEPQEGEVCTKLKLSARELHGEVWTRGAVCNSACPYIILGGTAREIAPDATLAVHSPRVILNFTGGVPTREMRAQALQQAMARSDRMVLDHITKLGADPALLTAARSVPFESMRILTREEIARFALDRRDRVDSPWMFEAANRGIAYKTILARKEGETSFGTTRFQLVCFDQNRFELDVERNVPSGSGHASLAMVGGDLRLNFLSPPRRSGGRETWGVFLDGGQVRALALTRMAELTDGPSNVARPDGVPFPVASEGLQSALKMLTDTCPPAKVATQPVIAPVPWQQVPWPQASAR